MCRLYLISLHIILLLIFVSVFSSCKDQDKNHTLLKQAVVELENNPQNAKELLESIPNPEDLPEAEWMQYQLTYIESKSRISADLNQDSVILKVCDYYDQQNDIKRGALAHFYVASYYYDNKEYGKALESYLMADHKAMMSGNIKLAGKSQNNIGYLFFSEGIMDSAVVHFNKALELHRKTTDGEAFELQVLSSLAAASHKKGDYNNAVHYYQKGIELAQKLSDEKWIAFFMQNIGATYCDMGRLSQSKEYLYGALPITINKADSVRLYLNLSRVYNKANQPDSVSYYSKLVEKNIADVTYKPTLRLIYTSLADYNEQIGRHEEFVRYKQLGDQTNEEILREQNAKELLDANEKFALTLRNEAEAQKKMWIRILGAFLLLTLGMVGLFARHKRKVLGLRRILLQKHKKELNLENDLAQQRSFNLSTTLNTYEGIVKNRKEIIDDEEFQNIEKEKLDTLFDKIRQNTNYLFIEWSKSTLKSHPNYKEIILSLSSEELRIMHLLHLEYSYEAIAEMLGFGYDHKDMDGRIEIIKNKLLRVGMRSNEVNAIFAIEGGNSQTTIS